MLVETGYKNTVISSLGIPRNLGPSSETYVGTLGNLDIIFTTRLGILDGGLLHQ